MADLKFSTINARRMRIRDRTKRSLSRIPASAQGAPEGKRLIRGPESDAGAVSSLSITSATALDINNMHCHRARGLLKS